MSDFDPQKLIPDKPSGFNGQCRSKLSMAASAAGLGQSALVPPVVGAVNALVNGGITTIKNVAEGHPGAAATSALTTLPAAAAGFFGGGAAADAAQGVANVAAHAVGANNDRLPNSDSEALAQDATCKPASTGALSASQVPAPVHKRGPLVTLPTKTGPGGWKTTVSYYRP